MTKQPTHVEISEAINAAAGRAVAMLEYLNRSRSLPAQDRTDCMIAAELLLDALKLMNAKPLRVTKVSVSDGN